MKSLPLTLVAIVLFFVAWIVLTYLPEEVRRQLEPEGPRGFLLPMHCEQCRMDFRRGYVSEPHGHVVMFIEPADGLRRDGVLWRFRWEGKEAVCSREGFAFLPSQQPCPDAYLAWKEGRSHEYAEVLYTPALP